MPLATLLTRTADEVAAFLLGASCAGCDEPGTLLCGGCRIALAPRLVHRQTPGGLRVIAALPFEGVAARVIRHLKEEGETTLARPLGRAFAAAVHEAGEGVLVPIPTSRAAFRRRGFRVPELLIRRAGYASWRLLLPARATADQRELGREERVRNVRGSMRVSGVRHPISALVMDDVTTSGATLDEAARVLSEAGIRVVGAVAVAATPARL